jgi:hypothetical protein
MIEATIESQPVNMSKQKNTVIEPILKPNLSFFLSLMYTITIRCHGFKLVLHGIKKQMFTEENPPKIPNTTDILGKRIDSVEVTTQNPIVINRFLNNICDIKNPYQVWDIYLVSLVMS